MLLNSSRIFLQMIYPFSGNLEILLLFLRNMYNTNSRQKPNKQVIHTYTDVYTSSLLDTLILIYSVPWEAHIPCTYTDG